MTDVLTLGEALLRFTPPGYKRFEQSPITEWHVGGSELNTAVGLARMGLNVRWVSRLPEQVMARYVERTLLIQGVDVSHIAWTQADRLGTYYMEEGVGARPSEVTYDRAHSAMSKMTPDDLDLAALFATRPRLFHTTGITMALSASAAQTVDALLGACEKHGVPVSFDFNYRSKLWGHDTARQRCQPVMEAATLIFIPVRDAQLAYGTDQITDLHAMFPQATLIMTRGSAGAVIITPAGAVFEQGIFPTATVCRVGGGDAFAAGALYGYLSGMDMPMILRYGAALAALKYSLPGDMPLVVKPEVDALVGQGTQDIVR